MIIFTISLDLDPGPILFSYPFPALLNQIISDPGESQIRLHNTASPHGGTKLILLDSLLQEVEATLPHLVLQILIAGTMARCPTGSCSRDVRAGVDCGRTAEQRREWSGIETRQTTS
jgi:hypothetical protein